MVCGMDNTLDNTLDEALGEALEETPKAAPDEASVETPEEASEAAPDEVPDDVLDELAEDLDEPADALEEPVEDAADAASGEAAGDTAGDAADESPENPLASSPADLPEISLAPALEASAAAASTPAPAPGKHAKPAKKRSGTVLKIVFASLLIVLVAIVGLGYAYYHGKISLLQYDDGSVTLDGTIDDEDAAVLQQQAEMESAVADLPTTDPIVDYSSVERITGNPFDGSVINILLLGTDERSTEFIDAARSDTIILVSLNLDTGAIKLVSIERGMGVPVLEGRYEGEWDWITHIFRYGGADLMMKTVSTVFDVDVPYYVRVNFNTFISLVDAMGGIDVTLTQAEADGLNVNIVAYNRDLCDWVQAGENHMNGFLALQYARMRKIDSDWKRVVRQRNVIRIVLQDFKELSPTEFDEVLNTVLPLIKTNMTEKEITALLLKAPLFLQAMDIEELTVPVAGTYGSMTGMGGRSLYSADFPANAAILHEMFYGSDDDAEAEEG